VNTIVHASIIAAALLLAACGTPEMNAWGLPREDLREIARLVRAKTSEPILSYQRDPNDSNSIIVLMRGHDPEAYRAQRIRGRWVVHEAPIIL
jgi:hypothetical protein